MWIRATGLDIPLLGADPQLHATLRQYAETQSGGGEEDRTVQLFRAHIKHGLPAGTHQQPLVAKNLGMSPRSLHRKLRQQGYRYEDLVAQVRIELSRFYLRNGTLPITRIDDYVGYKNVSTFSTAFKKQTGLTPREWRQKKR